MLWKQLLFNSIQASLDGTKSSSKAGAPNAVTKPSALGFIVSMFKIYKNFLLKAKQFWTPVYNAMSHVHFWCILISNFLKRQYTK